MPSDYHRSNYDAAGVRREAPAPAPAPAAPEWTPGYRPSNGTEGDMFRREWCNRCERDHSSHIDGGDISQPGRWCCSILTMSLIERDGPTEWEQRPATIERDGRTIEVWETRCTAFKACWPCRQPDAVEPPRRKPPRPRKRPGQGELPGLSGAAWTPPTSA